ncbi:MAG TPA: EAL domain-containing protein [Burkholderiaceae bacterium]|nr:EAL domain-containing protein [Burkholderiaceae bacterium]HMX10546.1 EAL domain-containing protein [Burkholderiaceae bacterium]HNB44894.1 EAL domain-containing protein [Burkholderiaceae bacterium]HNG79956.1 EAL domain-containing protein [Burkholderiaceae bacterium]
MSPSDSTPSLQALRHGIDAVAATPGGAEEPALAMANAITERLLQVEADLREQSTLLRTVLDESPDFIILKDHEGNFLLTNAPVARFYGTTPEAMVGKHDGDFGCPPEMAEAFRRNVQGVMARGETEVVHEESRDARTGSLRHFRSIKKPFLGPDGRPRILVIAHDITDIREAQLRVEESERRLRFAMEATGDAVWDWHIPSGQLKLSQRWQEILGYEDGELSGTLADFLECLLEEDADDINRALGECLEGHGDYEHEHRMRRKDGRVIWVLDRGRVVERDGDGRPLRMVGSVADVTDKKRAQDLIWQQANYDTLTGLPNRNMFRDRLQREMLASDRSGRPAALLMLDLDEFKEVNDSLGHAWGDVLLQEAAQRLQLCVREVDTVARLGGDEFMILLGDVADPTAVTRVVHDVLRAVSQPFRLGSDLVYVTGSVGVTFYPDDAATPEELLRNVDQAMYAAKREGRNCAQYFAPAMQVASHERMRLITDLRTAQTQHQLQLYYQPIVDLASGRAHKAEALLRWLHPERGFISPAEFIPVAESTGMIHEIGDWVFHEAARQAARWRRARPDFQVSINVSPLQFENGRLALSAWLHHLRSLDVDGSCVVVEITEGLLMEAGPEVTRQLLRFRDAGVQVALDDFGTGYSSLASLNRLDIDYIKIDRAFVSNLAPNSPDLALCEGIVMMAHKLGLKVVAEGIETEQQRDLLLAAGCDYGQGYLFSRPVPASQFDALLSLEATLPA